MEALGAPDSEDLTANQPLRAPSRLRPWLDGLALALILAATFALRWLNRDTILIRDEGEYAHLGQQILRGAVPYRDIYNQKTPWVFCVMAAIQKVAGESLPALRLGTTLYLLLTVAVLYLAARKSLGRPEALWAALALAVMNSRHFAVFHSASAETFMLLWIAAALWAWNAADRPRRAWQALAAGLAAGVAYHTKQTGLALAGFLVVERIWTCIRSPQTWTADVRLLLRDLALVAVGFAVVAALTLGYFASRGALPAYIECTWTNNRQYTGQQHFGLREISVQAVRVVGEVAGGHVGLWLWGAAALVIVALRGKPSAARHLWILWAATGAVAFFAGHFYAHYYLLMSVPLALGAGIAAAWLWRRATHAAAKPVARAVFLAGLAVPWLAAALDDYQFFQSLGAAVAVSAPGWAPFDEAPNAARYLARQTRPDECILIVGSEPEIYYYARRPACTRMVIMDPMTGPYSFAARLRQEFIADLESRRPRYVLMVALTTSLGEYKEGVADLVAAATKVLDRDYLLETTLPRPAPSPPGRANQQPAYLLIFRRKAP